VTVHGQAVPVDVRSAEAMGFRNALLELYVPPYGLEWEALLDSGPADREEPTRLVGHLWEV
jgi:hypothetical protein